MHKTKGELTCLYPTCNTIHIRTATFYVCKIFIHEIIYIIGIYTILIYSCSTYQLEERPKEGVVIVWWTWRLSWAVVTCCRVSVNLSSLSLTSLSNSDTLCLRDSYTITQWLKTALTAAVGSTAVKEGGPAWLLLWSHPPLTLLS